MRDYLDHAIRDAGRIELRHHIGDRWLSGMFDDPGALRSAIAERADAGNLYTSVNAPRQLTVSNSMSDRALSDSDIAFVVRLPLDFDPDRPAGTPSTDGELAAAVAQRNRLVQALASLGWPTPATAVSGNGAHALYRVRLPADSSTKEMLTAVYRGLKSDFGTPEVQFDTSVRNPARIWRLYGCVNRKGTPTLDRPHRAAVARIPARWEAVSPRQVEALAASYARQPTQAPPRPAPRVDSDGDFSTLDVAGWFAAHGHYRRPLGSGMHAVRCPWEIEHSNVDDDSSTATVAWEATGRCWPNFRCLHAHCDGRGIRDVLALWGDADALCSRSWGAAS